MNYRKVALFIALDLAFLLALILIFAYYGISHLVLLAMGLCFLLISIYDLRSGAFSALFSDFLGFPETGELTKYQWLPILLSTLLLAVSLPVLLEHGLVNIDQRWAMQQEGQFIRLAAPAVAGGVLVIIIATWTVLKGGSNK